MLCIKYLADCYVTLYLCLCLPLSLSPPPPTVDSPMGFVDVVACGVNCLLFASSSVHIHVVFMRVLLTFLHTMVVLKKYMKVGGRTAGGGGGGGHDLIYGKVIPNIKIKYWLHKHNVPYRFCPSLLSFMNLFILYSWFTKEALFSPVICVKYDIFSAILCYRKWGCTKFGRFSVVACDH